MLTPTVPFLEYSWAVPDWSSAPRRNVPARGGSYTSDPTPRDAESSPVTVEPSRRYQPHRVPGKWQSPTMVLEHGMEDPWMETPKVANGTDRRRDVPKTSRDRSPVLCDGSRGPY